MATINWTKSSNNYISATEHFRSLEDSNNNFAFIVLQNGLIRSKSGKVNADVRSWIFYSDQTPKYLNELSDFEIVIYDIRKQPPTPEYDQMIDEILTELDRDVFVIVSPSFDIVTQFTQFIDKQPSQDSFLVGSQIGSYSDDPLYQSGNEDVTVASLGNIDRIYSPPEIFPAQPQFDFAPVQALYITIGQPNSGRREFFYGVENIVEIEKKGNWQKKIGDYLYNGYTIALQGMNQSRADRMPAIEIAKMMNIPVYLLWFTLRGKPYESVGETYPKIVYERYVQSFQEPVSDEGNIIRIN